MTFRFSSGHASRIRQDNIFVSIISFFACSSLKTLQAYIETLTGNRMTGQGICLGKGRESHVTCGAVGRLGILVRGIGVLANVVGPVEDVDVVKITQGLKEEGWQ